MAEAIRTERQRVHGKVIAGTTVTAILFAIIGYCVGSALYGTEMPAILGLLIGVVIGGAVGLAVSRSVLADTLEPGISGRNYVGARSPDAGEEHDRDAALHRQSRARRELAAR